MLPRGVEKGMEAGKCFRVLLVDEDLEMRQAYARLMRAAGYDVFEAASGAEALSRATECVPDLILLEMVLPDLDGIAVCQRLKADQQLQNTHVMLLSSRRTDSELQARSLEAGAEDCIARPITNQELLARVEVQLRLKQTLDQLQREVNIRRAAEAQLRERETIFRLLTETIDEVFWMSTPGIGRIIYVSPAYEKIWGRSCAGLYRDPRSFLEAVHPEDRERMTAAVADHARGMWQDHEYRILRPDGSVRWIYDHGFPLRDEHGKLCMLAGVARDITSRKEMLAQEKVRESEAQLRELAENLEQVLWLRTPDEILYINAAYEKIWGTPREDLYRNPDAFVEFVHADDRERLRCALEVETHPGNIK